MKEWKMHNMENERMENAHPEKDRIYRHWRKVENAHLENERMENAQHGKCTTWKMHNWKKDRTYHHLKYLILNI